MHYYKSEKNEIYAYEFEGSQEPGLIPITEAEADIILNPPPTAEQLQHRAEREKQSLMDTATIALTPLQDAVDLDMATKEEKAALLKWKKYRVLLNRVDCSTAPDIVWPEQPE
ncbi:tail fiber assembly protein [Xenorhabdus sp. KK7.4]|uniref:tail fiber assembly protein n=1 Tax=Xenorhabdus sp. KK7.4 TaxID=1851572 RepID=UPI000C03F9E1|nr:tail fiber assembly protein [Xenorhabdus sp. KK7.4]PHM54510.1 tail fiber assembly protein [Xenorhabdus sp. KK7.4]PHM55140.1 tail fiber assembly protein [Xenorhabdus sp. KK7.4]